MWFWEGVTKIILFEEGLKIYRGVENVSEKGGLNKKEVKRKWRREEYDLQRNYGFKFPTRFSSGVCMCVCVSLSVYFYSL